MTPQIAFLTIQAELVATAAQIPTQIKASRKPTPTSIPQQKTLTDWIDYLDYLRETSFNMEDTEDAQAADDFVDDIIQKALSRGMISKMNAARLYHYYDFG